VIGKRAIVIGTSPIEIGANPIEIAHKPIMIGQRHFSIAPNPITIAPLPLSIGHNPTACARPPPHSIGGWPGATASERSESAVRLDRDRDTSSGRLRCILHGRLPPPEGGRWPWHPRYPSMPHGAHFRT
jgi:hypothetical protein